MAYYQAPSNCSLKLNAFQVHVPDAALKELRQLIEVARIPPTCYENTQQDRRFGVTHKWITETRDYWLNTYDWRKREQHFNSFPQFTTTIKDERLGSYDVHFAALFSKKKDAIPIVFLHGWPGSYLEFLPLMQLLKSQYSAETLPYHVIVPSVPGFGFSGRVPVDVDLNWTDTARIFNSLVDGLGLGNEFVVQGGDIGSVIARVMAAQHSGCKAVHLNFLPSSQSYDESKLSEMDKRGVERGKKFLGNGHAYAKEQGTRPGTLGFTLSSSPIALLAWVGEKFLEWTDEDLPIETVLDDITLYWLTDTISTSFHTYRRPFGHDNPAWKIKQPLGIMVSPFELTWAPKEAMAKTGNLVFHREHDKGGHFIALERTDVFLQDVEDFIKEVWGNRGGTAARM